MGRLSRKHKSGTDRNRLPRRGIGGINAYHGNGQKGIEVPPTDGIPVLDVDVGIHPSSTNDATPIPIPIAPAVTSPRRIVCPIQTNYLTPFISSHSQKNATAISATLEMQPNEYCVFLTSMAKHGTKSQLPNLVVKIGLDVVLVTLELSTTIFNELSVRST